MSMSKRTLKGNSESGLREVVETSCKMVDDAISANRKICIAYVDTLRDLRENLTDGVPVINAIGEKADSISRDFIDGGTERASSTFRRLLEFTQQGLLGHYPKF